MTIKGNSDLYGLVLAGGRSSRMGFDKGLIEYHQDQPQRVYAYKLLERFCCQTYLGLRPDQQGEAGELPLITDSKDYEGPFKSILAAHDAHPLKAWLVVACDLPLLTENTLSKLVKERDRTKVATAYFNRQRGYPEPLLTIWEPEGLRLAKIYATGGHHSPGKFLDRADYKKVFTNHEQELMNVNKPDEMQQARKKLE